MAHPQTEVAKYQICQISEYSVDPSHFLDTLQFLCIHQNSAVWHEILGVIENRGPYL